MTKQDWEIKLEGAKKNTVLPEKQREQIIALYTRKIAEFEAADKKPEPKATVKKESAKNKIKTYELEDGYIVKILNGSEAREAIKTKEVYVIYDDKSEAAIEGYDDLEEKIKKGYKEFFVDEEFDLSEKDSKKETAKKPESKKDSKSHIEEDLAAIHEYFNSNNVSSGDLGMRLKHRYDITDISDKGLRELEKQLKAKKSSKKIDYDCDELIAKAKKAKAAAKERAARPQKTEVTKSKETIEKVHDKVQKNVEAGKFGKAQLQKLITETEDLLTFLKKTLKSL